MLEDILYIGDKIEMSAIIRNKNDAGYQTTASKKIYRSAIRDIISNDQVEILMPMEQGKYILLPVDREYNMEFQSIGVNYTCTARVIDRYKSENSYLILMELTSTLKKHQRRQYYRYSCVIDIQTRMLDKSEMAEIDNDMRFAPIPDLQTDEGIAIDISGGGMKFTSDAGYDKDSVILIQFALNTREGRKEFSLAAVIVAAKRLEKQKTNEYRVEYYKLDSETREEIIRFIFDEERRRRRVERSKQ